MAEIKPFRGMRYDTRLAGKIDQLCCPPYDIISEEERLEYIAENEYNVIRLELPREGEDVYKNAGDILDLWRDKGILVHEDKPAIYVYEEEFNAYNKRSSIKGIIARVKVEEFSKGVILPHEFTLSKAKTDRFNLIWTMSTQRSTLSTSCPTATPIRSSPITTISPTGFGSSPTKR